MTKEVTSNLSSSQKKQSQKNRKIFFRFKGFWNKWPQKKIDFFSGFLESQISIFWMRISWNLPSAGSRNLPQISDRPFQNTPYWGTPEIGSLHYSWSIWIWKFSMIVEFFFSKKNQSLFLGSTGREVTKEVTSNFSPGQKKQSLFFFFLF